ncbi:acetyl-CoA carboxylase [Streptomyces sp. XM4011]|uniref:carboxyl transferase domain-containing protein n=1 Tax=Streptomyces sp. XM4011 TaxID=2929780 RepID=UPI001FF8375F|nr:carboxyl transferase domain-containing protein [Streptomyces sp. XM4011]MCK1817046.1 acetyl-CoA carboxylase [Streptomyces sp. XM4011]
MRDLVRRLTDPGSFTELAVERRAQPPDGPIGWPGYDATRARAATRTGEDESVLAGTATLGGVPVVLLSFVFGYLGGSLGERTGDRIEAAYATALDRRLPLVSLIATGGSRMQEGMRALSQLQRVARRAAALRDAGLPQLAVLQDPTTGGGWAVLGGAADIALALPGAQVGFAGSRVRPPGADPAAYTAESHLATGQLDAVVPPDALRTTLTRYVTALARPYPGTPPPPAPLTRAPLPDTGWAAVRAARAMERPRADDYLAAYFTDLLPLGGDRAGGLDPGLRCGIGLRDGRAIAYVAQCGTANTPAGFRTASRIIRLAGRLGLPVLTLIDTPGAAGDAAAERAGAGPAIADTFLALATAPVPVTSLVIGEGGSGGAMALAAAGNTWATPDSYFSVIAPELAAAILKKPAADVPHLADALRLRPQDLAALGVAGIVSPPPRPERQPPDAAPPADPGSR